MGIMQHLDNHIASTESFEVRISGISSISVLSAIARGCYLCFFPLTLLGELFFLNANSRYKRKSIKELHKQLHKCNEQLQQFSHVNKKALDQYVNFTEQREDLQRRQAELDAADEKIKELISVLDMRKDESIEHTFKGVAKHFREVFSELVQGRRSWVFSYDEEKVSLPVQRKLFSTLFFIWKFSSILSAISDTGNLTTTLLLMKATAASIDNNDVDNDQDDDEPGPAEVEGRVEKYIGVKHDRRRHSTAFDYAKTHFTACFRIRKCLDLENLQLWIHLFCSESVLADVSFTGQGETQSMKQLSVGQKTVVALALIFAIQRCDPAPFYLFDEIDAALDPQYRTAVGNMVRRDRDFNSDSVVLNVNELACVLPSSRNSSHLLEK
ncbi:UNVERIFIED_CONTAM: Structural maintenance of chromosomes protein 3, partial [Sesamum indicum]